MLRPMEHAPLRPVPSRPTGPVDSEAAKQFVAAWLPGLSDDQATALALVSLVGHAGDPESGAVLGAARKELRRSRRRLPGSGWCERAELLISHRLDGDLVERDAARLDVHLRNCPRCVEHERRLVQATDALVAAFVEEHGAAAVEEAEPGEPGEPAELTVVGPEGVPEEAAPAEAAPEAAAPEETGAAPYEVAPPVEAGRAQRDFRRLASAVSWNVLLVIVVLLALASLALTVAGILGASI